LGIYHGIHGTSEKDKYFSELVTEYKGYLMAVILPIIRDPDYSQDVLQETFWQAYRSFNSFRGGNIKIWLARIATNKALDWHRKHKQLKNEIAASSLTDFKQALCSSAEEEYLRSKAESRLLRKLENLPPVYRDTLKAYLFEGKSYNNIANDAGIKVKTVESRLYRARQILKNNLKEEV